MKKSKKKEKKLYNNSESLVVDPIPTPKLCGCGDTEHKDGHCDGSHKKKEPRKMINRKEVQAEIDIDKDIRRLLRMEYYNHNQIASMVRGANLERVKQVDNERRKT
jgi:CDGSH-type Zn-finger protein